MAVLCKDCLSCKLQSQRVLWKFSNYLVTLGARMLIELLTPLLLATTPPTITLSENVTYSHAAQSQMGENGPISQMRTTTFGGTQTFDFKGKPNDSDNDSD